VTSSDELLRRARATTVPQSARPRRRLAVVTCMDTRIDPLVVLGAAVGDLHVIRNAGGVVTGDVVRSLAVSQRRLGTTAVDVVMHTDCGTMALDEKALRAEIGDSDAARMRFHTFTDLHEELRRGVAALRGAPALLHRDRIRGLIYDVDALTLTTVPV
jgi:carbonic anhydrase